MICHNHDYYHGSMHTSVEIEEDENTKKNLQYRIESLLAGCAQYGAACPVLPV